MGRIINAHHAESAVSELRVEVMDEPGAGGAHHEYHIEAPGMGYQIRFQNGPIKENGVNGVTQEALIAICIDRLECFQRGPFACKENASALKHLQEALAVLHSRTDKRVKRGVEGTNEV